MYIYLHLNVYLLVIYVCIHVYIYIFKSTYSKMVDLIDCLSTFIMYQVKLFICLTCFNKRITNKATNRMCIYNMFTCIHINIYFNVVKHRFKNMLCMSLHNYESVIIIELLCLFVCLLEFNVSLSQ